jgi:hypothetical protein
MRTTKRFSAQVLERFERTGRGTGTFMDYHAWHQVGRGDPASSGRSHWHIWRGRQLDLLSDVERAGVFFFRMLPNLSELLEQYLLSLEDSQYPLIPYGVGNPTKWYSGTRQIADELGIRHPQLQEKGRSTNWKMTTDLVGIGITNTNAPRLTVAAIKDKDKLSKRAIQLLRIEKVYWELRGATWLLLTPSLYHPQVRKNLEQSVCWANLNASAQDRAWATQLACLNHHLPYHTLIQLIASHLNSMERAQRALWQSIWSGQLTVDLSRPIRPGVQLKHITAEAFRHLNPVACQRSAWSWN